MILPVLIFRDAFFCPRVLIVCVRTIATVGSPKKLYIASFASLIVIVQVDQVLGLLLWLGFCLFAGGELEQVFLFVLSLRWLTLPLCPIRSLTRHSRRSLIQGRAKTLQRRVRVARVLRCLGLQCSILIALLDGGRRSVSFLPRFTPQTVE